MCFNVNGGLDVKVGCKDFVECLRKFDVILCSETWTNEFSNVSLEGYVSVCKHRKRKVNAKRDSGGLVCYFSEKVCKGISSEPCDLEDDLCFKLIKAFLDGRKMCFCFLCI